MKLTAISNLFPVLLFIFSFPLNAQVDLLNDEFDKVCSVSDWTSINVTEGWGFEPLESYDVNMEHEGMLTMMPYTSSWFQDYKGALLYKNISDDFVITSRIIATNRAGNGIPGLQYSLAGIMLRTPKTITQGAIDWVPGQENYIFLSIGNATGISTPDFEAKTTTNSNSSLSVTPINTNDVIIRVARIGPYIITLTDTGNGFEVRGRQNRSDMPSNMQIGFVTYTDWQKTNSYSFLFQNSNLLTDALDPDPSSNPGLPFNPDLIGQFDYARFNEVPAALQGLNLLNTSQVPDALLLTHLDYTSTPTELPGKKIWKGTIDGNWMNAANWNENSLPTAQDSVLIPDCDCPQVSFPTIGMNQSLTIAALELESGAHLSIETGVTLTVTSNGNIPVSPFINAGIIDVAGTLQITREADEVLRNEGEINVIGSGVFEVLE